MFVFCMVSHEKSRYGLQLQPSPMGAAGLLGLNLVFTSAAKSADADGSPSPQFYKKLKYGPACLPCVAPPPPAVSLMYWRRVEEGRSDSLTD